MWFLFLVIVCPVASQEPHYRYNLSTTEWNGRGSGVCPSTEKVREKIKDDVISFLNSSVVSIATRPCGCVDGEELPISIYLTQHRLAHQLGSSLILQEDPVEDFLVLVA
jgi:hypothetical protein